MPIGDEYIQWPGEATFPGKDTYPAYDASAAGNSTVHSHKGWEWVESENPFQQAVASLANAAIATAVQRSRTTFGQVYYQRGNSTDPPDFTGDAIGDTCRIQDPGTLDIVAEWKWNGTAWERALVSGQQISNLDVGRLTAGSAAINELAARRIAGDVGKFLQISTDQLVVSGQATINTAVVQEIWSKIIHAQEGEFERIKAGMISGNAFEGQTFTGGTFEGQVITGAQIQTAKTGGRVLLNPTGLFAYRNDGSESFRLEAATGNIRIYGTIGLRDNWSVSEFTDFADNTDFRNGAGLHFTSLTRNFSSHGRIYIREYKGDSNPQLVIQAPAVDGAAPNMVFDSTRFRIEGFSGGSGRFWLNNKGLYFNNGTDRTGLRIERDYFTVRPFSFADRSVWASNDQVVVGYDQRNWAQWNENGMQVTGNFMATGNKNFVMPVPELSERYGKHLVHASTESPWDGIEYWQTLVLDGAGAASWELPEYVPFIAHPDAPRAVLVSSSRGAASASLDDSGRPWAVRVAGEPGAAVSVLVKLARVVDGSHGVGDPDWRARSGDDVWTDPVTVPVPPDQENG